MENFLPIQLEALKRLVKEYPHAVGIEDDWARVVFDSLIRRGTGLVELIETDETPTGDAYILTDAGADAFREGIDERAREAENN
jgi:hypothetical protein